MNKERYNQIIDEVYVNYTTYMNNNLSETEWNKTWISDDGKSVSGRQYTKGEFINKCKNDSDFSKKWGLIIKETYKLIPHTEVYSDFIVTRPVREYKLIVVYKNEIIEVYE